MKPTIESLQNPKIKQALRLRDGRARRRAGLILIDGLREIEVACRSGIAPAAIYGQTDSRVPAELEQYWQPVGSKVFEKLSYGQRGDAVAVASPPSLALERLEPRLAPPALPLLLVLDRAEKPGNIGAVARTVATAGATGLILVEPQCEVFNPNAIRASLGTVFSVPVAVCSLQQLAQWLETHQIRMVRACVDSSVSMWSTDLSGRLAIALGSEAWGLGDAWCQPQWSAVQIPMAPGADSLNLSVSAAVLCYEALRQRCGPSCSGS